MSNSKDLISSTNRYFLNFFKNVVSFQTWIHKHFESPSSNNQSFKCGLAHLYIKTVNNWSNTESDNIGLLCQLCSSRIFWIHIPMSSLDTRTSWVVGAMTIIGCRYITLTWPIMITNMIIDRACITLQIPNATNWSIMITKRTS